MKKNFKLILALVLSIMMVLSSVGTIAIAEVPTGDGSITIHSPIMGAKYFGYKVFDMTMNKDGDAFSYTINKNSPFYEAVKAYAEDTGEDVENTAPINGLTLTATSADPDTFNISVSNTFSAQAFGQYLEAKINDRTVSGADVYKPTYEDGANAVTVATANTITFENLPLGYYLILSQYERHIPSVKLEGSTVVITEDMTAEERQAAIDAYVEATVTEEYVDDYIQANPGTVHGSGDNGEITDEDKASVMAQLKASMTEDLQGKVATALATIAASIDEADDNALTQRMVFIDSTTPHADINEKNETHRWDVPVNPEGSADLKPHGEPSGGKNIVIEKDGKDYYVDWTEANVGDLVHYQLSINATNFERTNPDDPDSVKQIKEYIVADFENKNMTYNAEKGLKVTIVTKEKDGTIKDTLVDHANYDDWAGEFFHNDNKTDLGTGANGKPNSLFTGTEGGMVIPWVYETTEKPEDMTLVSTTEKVTDVPAYMKNDELTEQQIAAGWKAGEDGYARNDQDQKIRKKDKDGEDAFETETHYFVSLYPNDVTILVDYYMTLNDTATIDGLGNINISQYGVTFVEEEDYSYTPPKPEDHTKPTEEKEHDDAKVYTYALAIHKVDEKGNDLAGAKFKIKGLKVTQVKEGWYKVAKLYTEDIEGTNDVENSFDYADELVTDSKGFLVIEGLMTSQEVEIMETEAPDGYNKLEGTEKATPKEIGNEVKTSSTVIYYSDAAKTQPTGKVVTETDEQHWEGQVFKSVTTTTYTYVDGKYVEQNQAVELTGTAAPNEIDQTQLKPVEIKVVNNKGAELPSTGGMGTTIFYVGGSILVLAAAILLITKRRMGTND